MSLDSTYIALCTPLKNVSLPHIFKFNWTFLKESEPWAPAAMPMNWVSVPASPPLNRQKKMAACPNPMIKWMVTIVVTHRFHTEDLWQCNLKILHYNRPVSVFRFPLISRYAMKFNINPTLRGHFSKAPATDSRQRGTFHGVLILELLLHYLSPDLWDTFKIATVHRNISLSNGNMSFTWTPGAVNLFLYTQSLLTFVPASCRFEKQCSKHTHGYSHWHSGYCTSREAYA